MRLPSNMTLVKIASVTGLVGITGVMLLRNKVKSEIRNSDFFRDAVKTLRAHPGAVLHLGEPIKEYGFDLTDPEHNYCNGKTAQFEVVVRGPKDKGTMYFWSQRNEQNSWNISRMELELKSVPDKRMIIKKEES